jgi:hypothetical protein
VPAIVIVSPPAKAGWPKYVIAGKQACLKTGTSILSQKHLSSISENSCIANYLAESRAHAVIKQGAGNLFELKIIRR